MSRSYCVYRIISEVVLGDRVLAADTDGSTSFSTVIAVPHGKNSIAQNFNHISTASRDIKMTPDHLILSGTCGSSYSAFSLTKAGDVQTGACIRSVDGEEEVLYINEEVVTFPIYAEVEMYKLSLGLL